MTDVLPLPRIIACFRRSRIRAELGIDKIVGDGTATDPSKLTLNRLATPQPGPPSAAPYVIGEGNILRRSLEIFTKAALSDEPVRQAARFPARPHTHTAALAAAHTALLPRPAAQLEPPVCWRLAVEEAIFAPLGLDVDALYLWDDAQRQDLLARNPCLEASAPHRTGSATCAPAPRVCSFLVRCSGDVLRRPLALIRRCPCTPPAPGCHSPSPPRPSSGQGTSPPSSRWTIAHTHSWRRPRCTSGSPRSSGSAGVQRV